ncbi:MAG: hypothetical protein BWX88_02772 [Planctomycetes bacterium ADurb.Bin126]|nr:MAG: hypothetical protein BWX88_02772 [Planctomycetes bacterium ADurb.Bin126]HOD79943.1 hypothetical protein [Phycisphaerae bacterium]HQL73242.1 hypothetical protein [Phycisphaerae bacterium]
MTDGAIQLVDGEVLLVDGELAVAEDCCCADGGCADVTCAIGYPVGVTATGTASCVSDTYNTTGGWCSDADLGPTYFDVSVTCQLDGTYLVEILPVAWIGAAFSGTATTAELTCDGDGHYSGTIVLDGVDIGVLNGGYGPDWSGETATVVF